MQVAFERVAIDYGTGYSIFGGISICAIQTTGRNMNRKTVDENTTWRTPSSFALLFPESIFIHHIL